MTQGVRLVRVPELPETLTKEGSQLTESIRVADEACQTFIILQQNVHEQAKKACPQFQPDLTDPAGLLCRSGQGGEPPFRGLVCATQGCKLSQVVLHGDSYFYTGDDTREDILTRKIFQAL